MSGIQIHYDGDIAKNHQVSLRTLGKTLTHLQSTLDRAYLEIHHGDLYKYAKMHHSFYEAVELLVQEPREGGYILDFLTSNSVTKQVIDRVNDALNNAFNQMKENGMQNASNIQKSVEAKVAQTFSSSLVPKTYEELLTSPDKSITTKYADRAIVREFDQMLSIIRSSYSGNSTFEIELNGSRGNSFSFNRSKATSFHRVVTQKKIGDPVIYKAKISLMDRHNLTAKIVNNLNSSISTLHFIDEDLFDEAVPFFQKKIEMKFIGSPYIEYGAFDPISGDIYYLRLL